MFEQFIGTKPVEERHRIDAAALGKFLGFELLEIAQFTGGQSNPTYRISSGDGRRFVLRRKPPGKLLPSAHAVERGVRAPQALPPPPRGGARAGGGRSRGGGAKPGGHAPARGAWGGARVPRHPGAASARMRRGQ